MTRPLGYPPTPSAMSRVIEPVGITGMSFTSVLFMRMIDPLPKSFSIFSHHRVQDLELVRVYLCFFCHLVVRYEYVLLFLLSFPLRKLFCCGRFPVAVFLLFFVLWAPLDTSPASHLWHLFRVSPPSRASGLSLTPLSLSPPYFGGTGRGGVDCLSRSSSRMSRIGKRMIRASSARSG